MNGPGWALKAAGSGGARQGHSRSRGEWGAVRRNPAMGPSPALASHPLARAEEEGAECQDPAGPCMNRLVGSVGCGHPPQPPLGPVHPFGTDSFSLHRWSVLWVLVSLAAESHPCSFLISSRDPLLQEAFPDAQPELGSSSAPWHPSPGPLWAFQHSPVLVPLCAGWQCHQETRCSRRAGGCLTSSVPCASPSLR